MQRVPILCCQRPESVANAGFFRSRCASPCREMLPDFTAIRLKIRLNFVAARNVPNAPKSIDVTILPRHQSVRRIPPQLCSEAQGRCGDKALYPLTDVGALQVDFAVLCHDAFHLVAGFVPLVQCHRVLRSRLIALNNSTKREVCKIQNCFARHT